MALTTDNIAYNGTGTAITITLNSLTASATVGRQSTVVDNTGNKYIDVGVTAIISTAGSLATPNIVSLYIAGSMDGTNYDQDSAVIGAVDASYTIDSPTNLKFAGNINCSTTSKVYNRTFTIAPLFGGTMPEKWVLVVVNNTGATLAGGGNSASYTGITYTNQ